MRIHLFSIHGLFRGNNLELGRDADNGGQIAYVMELARALAQRPEITHVHLFTRRMDDSSVGPDYALPVEKVSEKFDIRRIWCGGKKYLAKEMLWPHLDEFVNNAITHIKTEKIFPDWMHSHYADAGYVAMELSSVLNVPFCHTGHSLGRHKLEKLLNSGMEQQKAMERFAFAKRFDAEERTLANAEFLITSTDQEIKSYGDYAYAAKAEYHVIPPGIDFQRFYPYYNDLLLGTENSIHKRQVMYDVTHKIDKFLTNPDRPLILTICRPDKKKNIDGLIHAFGTDPELQAIANLAIFAGIRSDISTMPSGEKEVLTEILLLMDKYNLYGKLAIPKKHESETDVPEIYRLCARKRGVFANIALTEPFGLTLLEASACGCPVVATSEGGPTEIVNNCSNGLIVDPSDTAAIQAALKKLLINEELWNQCSTKGIEQVHAIYSWNHHVESYLKLIDENLAVSSGLGKKNMVNNPRVFERLKVAEKMFITDIDGTLINENNDYSGLEELKTILHERGNQFVFGVASGRSLTKVKQVLSEFKIPVPDIIISSVGAYIHYGWEQNLQDRGWEKHINYGWDPEAVRYKLRNFKGLELQAPEDQNPFKVSYYIRDKSLTANKIETLIGPRLARNASIILSRNEFLDILPNRSSKGRAVRYVSHKWSIAMGNVVVSGDSGNDLDMFTGLSCGIVVGNHAPELEELRGTKRVFFAESVSAAGILEGLKEFGFIGSETAISVYSPATSTN
jgi:sucrose-phosphate synthase